MLTKITLKKLIDSPVPGDKMPSHAIIGADDKYENKTTVGKLWLKKNDNGAYLSGELQKEFTKDDGTVLDGYVLITQKEYRELKGTPSKVDTGEALNTDDIPF